MTSFAERLTESLSDAFAAAGLAPTYGRVTPSDRPDLGDFQCNGALAAAREARMPPRRVAETVVEHLRGQPHLGNVSLAGPGFINLTVSDAYIAEHMNEIADDARLGLAEKTRPATVILDFGGPNVAKPMHVGHLRATIIGDCLQRLFRLVGDRVISDVHLGDWGLPMGMLISELARRRSDLPFFDPGHDGGPGDGSPVTLDDLEEMYPAAAAACKADPERLEEARVATAELQAGRPGYRALWRHFVDVSVSEMLRDFGGLGVCFDLFKGEADVHELIGPMIESLRQDGRAVEDAGALVMFVAEEGDSVEVPPLILQKSDGGVMYGTTDLATIIDRVNRYDPDAMLYVVDQRQHMHFEQVFRAARKTGFAGRASLEHIGFGTMNGTDGKPFKTRAGGVMKLQDLMAMAREEALRRLEEAGLAAGYPEEERAEIARMVGIAAVKFADLANHRMSNYIFDLDRFMLFEGRTGPYLQYAVVRVKSILRKAAEQGAEMGPILAPEAADRELMLTLGQFPDAVRAAYDKRAPNELCDYAYGLAQSFSRFYANCHILSEADAARRGSWLSLVNVTMRTLETVLALLGMEVPERM